MRVRIFAPLAVLACTCLPATVTAGEWISPPEQVTLVELYTSEGCSSCPPADRWLARLESHPDLWTRVVPLGFHVDYWDHLGWHDRFASAAYSDRQRYHKRVHNVNGVYTPGFVVDGREWRGFFTRSGLPHAGDSPGVLGVTRSGSEIAVHFTPLDAGRGPFVANVAWLGFDLEDEISRGENRGKTLVHDFVVLEHRTSDPASDSWQIESSAPAEARAIAVWISDPESLAPIQATGGWLR